MNYTTLQIKRNSTLYSSRTAAVTALINQLKVANAGEPIIAIYDTDDVAGTGIKVLLGISTGKGTTYDGSETTAQYQIFEGCTLNDSKTDIAVPETVAAAITAAKNEILGGASETYNTLGKVETIIKGITGEGGSVQNQIAAELAKLDNTVANNEEGKQITVTVTQTDGKLTAVAVEAAKFALSSELSAETKARTTAISAMTLDTVGGDGKFVKSVSQANGIVTAAEANLNAAAVAATDIVGTDATVGVTGKTVEAQISDLAKTIKTVNTAANAEYKIEEVTEGLAANVLKSYKLTKNGTTVGSTIDIPKDGQLKNVEVTNNDKGENQVITFTYSLGDGTEDKVVSIDLSKAIFESEMGNGLEMTEHNISIKLAEGSEDYLSVDENGLKLSGVKTAIDTAVNTTLTVTPSGTGNVITDVTKTDNTITVTKGNVSADQVTTTAIASANDTVAVDGTDVKTQITNLAKAVKTAENTAATAINGLEYTDPNATAGTYVTKVTQSNGKIAVTHEELKASAVKLETVTADEKSMTAANVQAGIAELFTNMLANEKTSAEAINKLAELAGFTNTDGTLSLSDIGGVFTGAASLVEALTKIKDMNVIDCGTY